MIQFNSRHTAIIDKKGIRNKPTNTVYARRIKSSASHNISNYIFKFNVLDDNNAMKKL